jgi:hypothetical protein
MRHKVSCVICGKKGIVNIDHKTRMIVGRDWYYYKKFNVNCEKTEKYLYRVISLKPKLITRKYKNPNYDRTAKPKLVEHWECSKCNKA